MTEGMIAPQIPANEQKRLAALFSYNTLDTSKEPQFDDCTFIAAEVCGVSMAFISLIDSNRQWFKSSHGADLTETSREISFCAHAINSPSEIFEIPDTLEDERFYDNPLVTGEPFIRYYAGAPLIDENGHCLGTLCLIDQTPVKLSDKQRDLLLKLGRQVMHLMTLQRKVRESDQFFELSMDVMMIIGRDGQFRKVSPSISRILGREERTFSAKSFLSLVHPEDMPAVKKVMRELVVNSCLQNFVARLRHKDGSYKVLSWSALAAPDGMIFISAGDVTVQQEAERGLEESLKMLERGQFELLKNAKLLEQAQAIAQIGHWEIDLVKETVFWSDATQKIHEVTEDYVPNLAEGINFYDEESRPIITEMVQRCIATGQSWDVKLRIITAKENLRWVRSVGRSYSEGDKVVKVFGLFQDITEDVELQKQLQDRTGQLERTSEELQQFTYIATHDLKGPIANLKGHLEILKIELSGDNEEVQGSIGWMEDSIQMAEDKIKDVVTVAQAKKPSSEQLEKMHLKPLVERVVGEMQELLAKESGTIKLDIPDELMVRFNRMNLMSVLRNLLGNALKYRDFLRNPEITVSGSLQNDKQVLIIEDNGLGIDLEQHGANLFRMFERCHDHVEGTGMGLYLSKKIIENHGGQISVESESGVGARFKVTMIP